MKNKPTLIFIIVVLVLIIFILLGYIFYLKKDLKSNLDEEVILIESFEQCVEAGNLIMESYPRRCRTEEGNLFIEELEDEIFEADSLNDDYFYTPNSGEVFYLGDKIEFSWDPEKIEAENLILVPISDYITNTTGTYLYTKEYRQWDDLDNGLYTYEIPDYISSIYPGFYRLVVQDYNRIDVIYSDVFEIKSKTGFEENRVDNPPQIEGFELEKVSGGYNLYVSFMGGDGKPLSDDENWNTYIAAIVDGWEAYDGRITGKYNVVKEKWEFFLTDFMYQNYKEYDVQAWCGISSVGSACAEKYGHMNTYEYLTRRINI